jgi:hypothetical protein
MFWPTTSSGLGVSTDTKPWVFGELESLAFKPSYLFHRDYIMLEAENGRFSFPEHCSELSLTNRVNKELNMGSGD